MKTAAHQGFTLIELIVVIVILGILAATALPKFVDLSGDAEQAATNAVAGSVSSWASVNYGAKKAGNGTAYAIDNTTDGCLTAANNTLEKVGSANILSGSSTLIFSGTPATTHEYVVSSGAPKACGAGVTIQCTLTSKNLKTATAYIPCTN